MSENSKIWTDKMRKNRNPKIYKRNGDLDAQVFWDTLIVDKPREQTDDTKMRTSIMNELEERVGKGEEIDSIVEEISQREEVKNQFSYYSKNGITTPLSTIFKNWYISKQKNKPILDKINCLDDRTRD